MLSISNLGKIINGCTIIDDLSFSLNPGERACLSAPSGAGKSTLIHILSGLDTAFSGTVHVTARSRATIFQEPGLFWYKTVAENIFYPLKLNGIKVDKHLLQTYEQWMSITGLNEAADFYPHTLSGGMKHKVAMIRAFLTGPDLILMDEPFRSMDMASRTKIMDHIRNHYPDITLLLVTHHLDEMPRIAQRVFLFKEKLLSNRFESLELLHAPET
ncbi:ATP-binding cassette domain-containing protein [Desulfocicer niacini]